MSKLNKILLVLVVVLLIALGVAIYWQKSGDNKPYWAIYLNTGDIYFGKVNYFPKFHLSDVWLLQRNPQDSQNPFSILKFDEVAWGPQDAIYVNPENIVWKAKLKEDSEFLKSLKNPPAPQSQPQSSQPPSQPQIKTDGDKNN